LIKSVKESTSAPYTATSGALFLGLIRAPLDHPS
jgi:hypothetical protein